MIRKVKVMQRNSPKLSTDLYVPLSEGAVHMKPDRIDLAIRMAYEWVVQEIEAGQTQYSILLVEEGDEQSVIDAKILVVIGVFAIASVKEMRRYLNFLTTYFKSYPDEVTIGNYKNLTGSVKNLLHNIRRKGGTKFLRSRYEAVYPEQLDVFEYVRNSIGLPESFDL
jgi:hypothetical protein